MPRFNNLKSKYTSPEDDILHRQDLEDIMQDKKLKLNKLESPSNFTEKPYYPGRPGSSPSYYGMDELPPAYSSESNEIRRELNNHEQLKQLEYENLIKELASKRISEKSGL